MVYIFQFLKESKKQRKKQEIYWFLFLKAFQLLAQKHIDICMIFINNINSSFVAWDLRISTCFMFNTLHMVFIFFEDLSIFSVFIEVCVYLCVKDYISTKYLQEKEAEENKSEHKKT